MIESEYAEEEADVDDLTGTPRDVPRPEGASNYPTELNIPTITIEDTGGTSAQGPSDEPLQLISATTKM